MMSKWENPRAYWPNAPEELAAVADGVPDDDLRKMGFENACRWYHFDPFVHRTREQSTVAALRAEAEGHDVTTKAYDKGRFTKQVGVDLGELAKNATA